MTPPIRLLHGGQTGVDRGAHQGAIHAGWEVAGFMPLSRCDERGPIPADVAVHLAPWHKPGYGARTEANVRRCGALLVVVPNLVVPDATPGTRRTLELAAELPCRIADPLSDPSEIARWIRALLQHRLTIWTTGDLFDPYRAATSPIGPLELLVAGPRESKWASGHGETELLIHRVAHELRAPDTVVEITKVTAH